MIWGLLEPVTVLIMNCYKEGFRLPHCSSNKWTPPMFDNMNGISVKPLAGDKGHLNAHSCTHTSKDMTGTKGRQNGKDSIFPLAKRSWHVFDKLAKTTAELIWSFYFQRSSSYVNTLVKVAVVMKPEETGLPLAGSSVHKANRNVTEHWHPFHFELNTALPCVSRDNIKFCVWVIPGILQAGVELYVAG